MTDFIVGSGTRDSNPWRSRAVSLRSRSSICMWLTESSRPDWNALYTVTTSPLVRMNSSAAASSNAVCNRSNIGAFSLLIANGFSPASAAPSRSSTSSTATMTGLSKSPVSSTIFFQSALPSINNINASAPRSFSRSAPARIIASVPLVKRCVAIDQPAVTASR